LEKQQANEESSEEKISQEVSSREIVFSRDVTRRPPKKRAFLFAYRIYLVRSPLASVGVYSLKSWRTTMGRWSDWALCIGLITVFITQILKLVEKEKRRRAKQQINKTHQQLLKDLTKYWDERKKRQSEETASDEFVEIVETKAPYTILDPDEIKVENKGKYDFEEYLQKTVNAVRVMTDDNIDLVIKSSPAWGWQVKTGSTDEIKALKQQLGELKIKIENQKSEIIQVQKIDPVLETTLRMSVENLTNRIERLEKDAQRALTKWDVAIVAGTMMGAAITLIGAVGGAIWGIITFFH
jgi:hypothetical protein